MMMMVMMVIMMMVMMLVNNDDGDYDDSVDLGGIIINKKKRSPAESACALLSPRKVTSLCSPEESQNCSVCQCPHGQAHRFWVPS